MEIIDKILAEVKNTDNAIENKIIVIEELIKKVPAESLKDGVLKRMINELKDVDSLLLAKLQLIEEIQKVAPHQINYTVNTKELGTELWKEFEGSVLFDKLLKDHLIFCQNLYSQFPKTE